MVVELDVVVEGGEVVDDVGFVVDVVDAGLVVDVTRLAGVVDAVESARLVEVVEDGAVAVVVAREAVVVVAAPAVCSGVAAANGDLLSPPVPQALVIRATAMRVDCHLIARPPSCQADLPIPYK